MQSSHALDESVQLFFGDFDFSMDFQESAPKGFKLLYDVTILIDILDHKNTILYSIFMGGTKESAGSLTSVLVENPEPSDDEVNSTMMEMLNIFAGHAINDLPPFENEEGYYFLAPPILQKAYVVDPKDFSLELSREVLLKHNPSKKDSSLHFCLFKKLYV